jgi:hypothetical protein
VRGPAFCDPAGEVASSFTHDAGFVERLLIVQAARPDVIPAEVDISEQFGRAPPSGGFDVCLPHPRRGRQAR